MLTAFEAAATAGVSSHTIYRWAEAGEIHSRVTPEGVLFVCPNSLDRMP
jgi:predicted site-specific integrase-resolvase